MIFFVPEMALFITSLNSGSNGNCYYVANDTEAVLVDAGISCRETEKRMGLLNLSMNKVKAIFISHEHSDHIKGAESIAEKYSLPVYITNDTARRGRLHFKKQLINYFTGYEPVRIGDLSITAFPKLHDAADPHSFIISGNGITVGIFTDIGACCNHVTTHFSQCHAAFLEANYDEAMLEEGRYPLFLKNRIRGGNGHLSNAQALEIFITHRPSFMTHLLLAHLSKDNNNPQLVQQLFSDHANGIQIMIASREEQTPVFIIRAEDKKMIIKNRPAILLAPMQLKLF
ncbi:MBL fold metallo-hydrolase [Ferruginibacter sp.]|uniref:MBL fold metallo-hydrolase n=1 Tax=Ferruginibacter sp. TaxID=1940288 RepID=UPI002657EEAC|nr:MBL fold metallo-hydrolase [Ferruginibacter sp.]